MSSRIQFDYYYGAEAEQFTFFRVPKVLIQNEQFKGLSSDAKLLYGLMLDRMGLSRKNNWYEDNKAFIYYTIDNIMQDMGCSKPTALKILKELDSDNGIGLVERKRQGQGLPDKIFVKNFVTIIEDDEPENTDKASDSAEVKGFDNKRSKNFTTRSKEPLPQEVKDFDYKESKVFTTRGKEDLPQEVNIFAPNNTNTNYTDFSETESNPINPSREQTADKGGWDEMDEINAYTDYLKQNLEYDWHMQNDSQTDREEFLEIFNLIRDVVCFKPQDGKVRLNGKLYPYEIVKSQMLKLDNSHIDYVRGCLKNTTTKIGNINAYLLTALYNAPSTISHYYQQEVQHDMYGGGWHEKGII